MKNCIVLVLLASASAFADSVHTFACSKVRPKCSKIETLNAYEGSSSRIDLLTDGKLDASVVTEVTRSKGATIFTDYESAGETFALKISDTASTDGTGYSGVVLEEGFRSVWSCQRVR